MQLSPRRLPPGTQSLSAPPPPSHTLEHSGAPRGESRQPAGNLRQGWGLGLKAGNWVIVLKDLEGYVSGNCLPDAQLQGAARDRGGRAAGQASAQREGENSGRQLF